MKQNNSTEFSGFSFNNIYPKSCLKTTNAQTMLVFPSFPGIVYRKSVPPTYYLMLLRYSYGKSISETQLLQDALLRSRQPWLEWSTKREKKQFEVDPVALHIHEKVSARAILKASERADIEEDLFSTQRLDREQERQFYQHDV